MIVTRISHGHTDGYTILRCRRTTTRCQSHVLQVLQPATPRARTHAAEPSAREERSRAERLALAADPCGIHPHGAALARLQRGVALSARARAPSALVARVELARVLHAAGAVPVVRARALVGHPRPVAAARVLRVAGATLAVAPAAVRAFRHRRRRARRAVRVGRARASGRRGCRLPV